MSQIQSALLISLLRVERQQEREEQQKIPATLEVKMHVEISLEAKPNRPLYSCKQGTNHLVS